MRQKFVLVNCDYSEPKKFYFQDAFNTGEFVPAHYSGCEFMNGSKKCLACKDFLCSEVLRKPTLLDGNEIVYFHQESK